MNDIMERNEDFVKDCTWLKQAVRHAFDKKMWQLPERLRDEFYRNCVLSGGAISSLYHGEKPKDFDLWSVNENMIGRISKEIELNRNNMEVLSEDEADSEQYGALKDGAHFSPNAITLQNGIQFITLGDYNSQRKLFDFIHCLPYYKILTDELFISERQWNAIKNKKLVDNNSERKTANRTFKYVSRGWTA